MKQTLLWLKTNTNVLRHGGIPRAVYLCMVLWWKWAWWSTPGVPVLGRWRQEIQEFKAVLSDMGKMPSSGKVSSEG